MKCSKCGREIEKSENYCPYCGTKVNIKNGVNIPTKSIWKAILLSSVITFIVAVILKVIDFYFPLDWFLLFDFATMLLRISIVTFILGLGYGFYDMIKNNKSFPVWYCTILAIIIIFIIIYIISNINRHKMDNVANKAYNEAYTYLQGE